MVEKILPLTLERKHMLLNPIALRMAKTPMSFGHSESNRVLAVLRAKGLRLF